MQENQNYRTSFDSSVHPQTSVKNGVVVVVVVVVVGGGGAGVVVVVVGIIDS